MSLVDIVALNKERMALRQIANDLRIARLALKKIWTNCDDKRILEIAYIALQKIEEEIS